MNLKNILIALIVCSLVLNVLFCGCVDEGEPKEEETQDNEETNDDAPDDIAGANNRFAFDLLSELDEIDNNTFFSPWSIFTAMGMTYEGARNETADEIRSVFHYPENDTIRRESFQKALLSLNQSDSESDLHLANAIWVQEDYNLLEEYKQILADFYYSGISNLNFWGSPEESRKIINGWVENKTNDLIKDLIPPKYITRDVLLVLTNAIYFKGEWKVQFNEDETEMGNFWKDDENKVPVPMMKVKACFNYTETEDFQVLEMPYMGNDLSMLVFLPKNGLQDSNMNELSLEDYENLTKELTEQEVIVTFPKFELEAKYFLEENLPGMGMPTAFGYGADFSGINGYGNIWIFHVIHQAFVEVNEQGTEAGASTAIIMGRNSTSNEQLTFNANHPFTFVIRENRSNNILFMGKVVDPTLG